MSKKWVHLNEVEFYPPQEFQLVKNNYKTSPKRTYLATERKKHSSLFTVSCYQLERNFSYRIGAFLFWQSDDINFPFVFSFPVCTPALSMSKQKQD